MKSHVLRAAFTALFLAFILAWAFFVNACSKAEAQLTTGRTIVGADLPGWTGDAVYAEVRAESLPSLYATFRAVLNSLGMVKWDERFDCNKFASLFVAVAQVKFAVAAWHSTTPAQSLALAEVWYRRADGSAHAIVQARTPAGDVFIDPQTGQRVQAVQPYFRKW